MLSAASHASGACVDECQCKSAEGCIIAPVEVPFTVHDTLAGANVSIPPAFIARLAMGPC